MVYVVGVESQVYLKRIKKGELRMKRIYSEHLTSKEYNAWLDYMLLIHCPLCEHYHKNNTFCQMPIIDEGGNNE